MILTSTCFGPALAFAVGTGTTFGPAHLDRHNPHDELACYRPARLTAEMEGIATWAAPCRARVLVCTLRRFRCAWTRVVDRGPRRALTDLTRPFARRIGHRGREPVALLWTVWP